MRKFSAIIIAMLFFASLNAQTSWEDYMLDPDVKLKDVQKAFESQNSNKSYQKGHGWKQYYRWENYWENRLMPDGSFPNLYKSYKLKWNSLQNKANENGNWVNLGPFNHTTTGSWSSGTGRVNVVRKDPNDSNTLYVGAPAGGLWRSKDNGSSWTPISDFLSAIGVSDIAIDPNDSQVIYLGTGDKDGGYTSSIGVVMSRNGGTTWDMVGPDMGKITRVIIDPNNSNTIWVAARKGLFKSMDQGSTWVRKSILNIKDLSINPGDSNSLYLLTRNKFYYSTDQVESFHEANGLPETSTRMVLAVTPANSSVVYVLSASSDDGAFQGLFKSTDSGRNFILKNNTTDIFDNSDQAWYDMAIAVSPIDENIVVTGLINIWRTQDSGVTFSRLNSWSAPSSAAYTHADIHFLNFDGNELYCGSDGGIYRSLDNGTTFTDLSAGLAIGQYYTIDITSQDNTIAGGLQDNGSYVRKDNIWKNYVGADGMESGIDPQNSNNIFGMIQYGGLYKSENGGDGIVSLGKPEGVEKGRWVTPMEMDPNGGRLIAGYEDLFEYDFNNGWKKISTFVFPGKISKIRMFKPDSDVIFVAVGENLYKSIDNGVSWLNITGTLNGNITSIDVHPTNHQIVWVTLGGLSPGNKVFATADDGVLWSNISENLPNEPVHVLKYDPITEGLYVGTDFGVYYKAKDSQEWFNFDQNLPNVIVKDIEINEGEKEIYIGTFGRGVWKSPMFGVDVFDDDVQLVEIISPNVNVCGSTINLEVKVRNLGLNMVNSLQVEYAVGNGNPIIYDWQGALSIGSSVIINVDNVSVSAGDTKVNVNIKMPNGTPDEDATNNVLEKNFVVNSNGSLGEFSLLTDCYASETSWNLKDANGVVIEEVSTNSLSNTQNNNYEFCLTPGCYTLTVEDTYGDGMNGTAYNSCGVNGDYSFLIDGVQQFVMGSANFGNSVSHEFCVGTQEIQWVNIPMNTTINCSQEELPSITGQASASSTCADQEVIVVYSDDKIGHQITRIWIATDNCDNTISYTQTITITDEINPVISCGNNIVLDNVIGPVNVQVSIPVTEDNCGVASVTNSINQTGDASGVYPLGTTTIIWTVMDEYDNIATCTQSVVLNSGESNGLENDVCSGAVSVAVKVFGQNDWYEIDVTSNGTAVQACSGIADDDTWYKFVATTKNDMVYANSLTSSNDLVVELYDACNGNLLQCFDNYSSSFEKALYGSLVVGNTYFYRVYEKGQGGSYTLQTGVNTFAPSSIIDQLVNADLDLIDQIYAKRSWMMYGSHMDGFIVSGYAFNYQNENSPSNYQWIEESQDGFYYQLYQMNYLLPGESYNVQVKHQLQLECNGALIKIWSDYGVADPIHINDDVSSTQVMEQYCNQQLTFADVIKADYVAGAELYEWQFESNGMTVLHQSPGRNVYLWQVDGISMGADYNVRVRTKLVGEWGAFGSACSISLTGAVAPPSIEALYCNITIERDELLILKSTKVAGAKSYDWLFVDNTTGETSSFNTIGYKIIFNHHLLKNNSYRVSVRANLGLVSTDYGATCQINVADLPDVLEQEYAVKSNSPDFIIYPNPLKDGRVTIALEQFSSKGGYDRVIVRDMVGRVVMSQLIELNERDSKVTLFMPNSLTNGMYFVELYNNKVKRVKKLIVKR